MSNETPTAGQIVFNGEKPTGAARIVVLSGVFALVIVVAKTTLDVLGNLPFDPIVASPAIRELSAIGAPVSVALAVVAIPFVTERTTVRVGLLFVGIFGLLPFVQPVATAPAAVAVTVGGGVTLLGTLGWPSTYRRARSQLIATGILGGLAVALSSSIGILNGGTRGIGALLTLGAVTAMAVHVEGDRIAVVAGALAFVTVIIVSATSPYVVGSVLLVALAIVGVPHLLVACAVGGATAVTIAGLRRREYTLAVGAPLVLLGGIPATFPRALTVVLGATLVLLDLETLVGDPTEPTEEVRA